MADDEDVDVGIESGYAGPNPHLLFEGGGQGGDCGPLTEDQWGLEVVGVFNE